MALEEIALAFWFLLPAYAANPVAVVFGGGTPIDFGRSLRDGHRVLGDGKTWRGLAGGVASGLLLGILLTLLGSFLSPRLAFGDWPGVLRVLVILPVGALLGDLAGAFVKRRLGKVRGERAPGLDQYDFLLGTLLFLLLLERDWWLLHYWTGDAIFGLAFIILITPPLHRVVNVIGYRWGHKREPW
ncbi:MAG: CDP-2,3-bis-(O-geranylgeranyl)-sn-glycerol synthase [Candidatus Thermoplasmatota archaeon]